MEARRREVKRLPHHEQEDLCTTRPAYRQGRILTAVKVYTVNDESQHLIVSGVPALGLQDNLRKLFRRFGDIKSLVYIPNYEKERFVEGYHLQYSRIQSARFAKRQCDGRAFFGGTLHVCYAPEMESVTEIRNKLTQRRHDVSKRCKTDTFPQGAGTSETRCNSSQGRSNSTFHSPVGDHSQETCIWNGTVTKKDPRLLVPARELEEASAVTYGPQPLSADWRDVGVRQVLIKQQKQKKIRTISPAVSNRQTISVSTTCDVKQEVSRSTVDANSNCDRKSSVPPVLRFVPSQVKGAQKKIIFHKSVNEDKLSGNKSLDNSIEFVRERIRAVGVPNIKILLGKDVQMPSNFQN